MRNIYITHKKELAHPRRGVGVGVGRGGGWGGGGRCRAIGPPKRKLKT